jgi:hypothetical protein
MLTQVDRFVVILSRLSLYFAVCESAQILGGKRADQQTFDEIGWWTKSIALEFDVPADKTERFERELREVYCNAINISIERKAAQTT